MLNTKFSPWPAYNHDEADAVQKVLLSNKVNYWTGTECREFEKEFAVWCETRYAIAVANGTVALDLALIGLEIGKGDEVIVTPRTFLASVSSIINVGATPVFVDVSANSQNIDVKKIKTAITARTKAIMAVHLAGWPCEMDEIMSLAEMHQIKVIEDCAQAHGAKYKGRPVGGIGHVGAWSFCQDKIMTTGGEGGMVTTNDPGLWSKMWSYKDHGKSWEAVYNNEHPPGFRWLHESFGTNWRLTEMQAAIGRIQLKRMDGWHAARLNNADKIWNAARKFAALRVPDLPDYIDHAGYKCYVFVCPEHLKPGWDRDRIITEIQEFGVPCYSGSCPEVYLEKAFDNMVCRPKERLSIAKELGETSLMFLIHPTLTEYEIKLTCDVLDKVMNKASV